MAAAPLLEAELAKLKANPPAPLPKIELRRGAGAYICGEESAMIESIEGKRGMPRLRPPYVAQSGFSAGRPLEHNFETLYWVRQLLEQGAAAFAAQGRHGRMGLRSFSVSGRVKEPASSWRRPASPSVSSSKNFCGGMQQGHTFYGYLPGGASGRHSCRPQWTTFLWISIPCNPYGCFIGSAAVIVLSDHDTAKAAARNMMRFFENESCGQCTPCRVGTAKANTLIAGERWDAPLLAELSQVMRDASICGLGQAAPESHGLCRQVFSERSDLEEAMNAITRIERGEADASTVTFLLDGREVTARHSDTLIEIADREGVRIPRLCYMPGMDAVGNCRSLHGGDQGRARACRVLLPQSRERHAGHDQERARAQSSANGHRTPAVGHAGERIYAAQRSRRVGGQAQGRQTAVRTAGAGRAGLFGTPPSPSISMPAFNVRDACAPAATNR